MNGAEKESVTGSPHYHWRICAELVIVWDMLKVLFNSSQVKLDFDAWKISVEDVEKAVAALGYEVEKSKVKVK